MLGLMFIANLSFEGGGGNDYLEGGTGDDTYIFNAGDGVDTIDDENRYAKSGVNIFGNVKSTSLISVAICRRA